jgi:hypothetical protein
MTVEWLDGAGDDRDADELPQPPPLPPGRRRALWFGGSAAAVAVGVAVALSQTGGGSHQAGRRPSTAAPTSSSVPAAVTSSAARSSSGAASASSAAAGPRVTEVGHRILGATTGWELFAQGEGAVLRIELAAGRVQTTKLPGLASGGGIAFVVGPTSAIVRPFDAVTGYVIPDGGPPRELHGLLAQGGSVYAGPTPDEIWIQPPSDSARIPPPRLYDLRHDRPVGTGPAAPQSLGQPFLSDGAGYLLYGGVGGVYDVRPDGVRRVTTGALAAIGGHRVLVQECDESYQCQNILIDQRSGTRRVLGTTDASYNYVPGSISPDGRYAAYSTVLGGDQPTTHLVDLNTGKITDVGVALSDAAYGSSPFVWDPENDDLLFVDNAQEVRVIDPISGHAGSLGIQLPPVTQLALRPASG